MQNRHSPNESDAVYTWTSQVYETDFCEVVPILGVVLAEYQLSLKAIEKYLENYTCKM